MAKSDQGVLKNRYKVIPRTLIFVMKGDNVLLLKGSPTKRIWANRFNGLGGHIERGEDVISAARRELVEESGLSLNEIILCGILFVDASEDIGISVFIFKGEYQSGEIIPSSEGELIWKNFSDCNPAEMVEDLPTLLPRVFAYKKGDIPFFAKSHYDTEEKLVIEFGT